MKIVMSYKGPDMDGVSCMYAYSELLNKLGEEANYFIWDTPRQEVRIVCDIFGIELKGLKENEVSEDCEFIVVDLNGKEQMHDIVKLDKLVEIIDHHSLSKWLPSYTSIERVQIDRLGAAATIVTERYKNLGIIPSRESAILLFYGIISNSINLKASITKQRDIDACNWLKSICKEISDEKIKEIFEKKSKIDDNNLRAEMECEIPLILSKGKVIVAQLEIANLEEFLSYKQQDIINVMKEVKKEKKVDYVFINCVDILNGYIMLFGADNEDNEFIKKTFQFDFDEKNIEKVNKIIQRKDMTRMLREIYN